MTHKKTAHPFSVYCLPVTLFSAAFFVLWLYVTREEGNVITKERQVTTREGLVTTGEGLMITREGQVTTEEGAFLACLNRVPPLPALTFSASRLIALAAPLELTPDWRDSAFPGLGGGVPPSHRPARQRGFSAAKIRRFS